MSIAPNVRPNEKVLLSTPIGLDTLGAEFRLEAPWSACRLCGAIYQTQLDRDAFDLAQVGRIKSYTDPLSNEVYYYGDDSAIKVFDDAADRRKRWVRLHERRYHTEKEIALLHTTGFAMTPEAAHNLAPFGITPLGNMHGEIVDALATAPRAPLDDAENYVKD